MVGWGSEKWAKGVDRPVRLCYPIAMKRDETAINGSCPEYRCNPVSCYIVLVCVI